MYDDPVDTFEHDGATISIYRDECSNNPRNEFDHLGTLHAQDRRHDSRDKGSDAWDHETDRGVAIPLRYQHDGTLGECDSFDDANGAIHCDLETIRREYSCRVVNPATRAKVLRCLRADAVFGGSWDADGHNADDQPCKRLLIWASEDADNDAGANAFAELSTVGSA